MAMICGKNLKSVEEIEAKLWKSQLEFMGPGRCGGTPELKHDNAVIHWRSRSAVITKRIVSSGQILNTFKRRGWQDLLINWMQYMKKGIKNFPTVLT